LASLEASNLQIPERAPAIVGCGSAATAIAFVPVLAAHGADSFTGIATHPLYRQGQQYLFPKDILQFQAAAFIKTYLHLAFVDLDFFLARDLRGRPIKQIERGIQWKAGTTQTSVALRTYFHCISAPDAHFASGVLQQFRHTCCVQGRNLLQFFTGKIDFPRLESFIETNLP
jgi:hypothetical protein